jgi:predicted enzyme related to lactoylglutathione lyase
MARPVHFEVHAADPTRAIEFYSRVFGWEFNQYGEGYWLITTGPSDQPGIDGGLVARRGPPPAEGQPVNAWPCTIGVDDLDATFAQALAHGATTAVPRMAIPGVGWLAYVKDTEGNILGLMQPDTAAR